MRKTITLLLGIALIFTSCMSNQNDSAPHQEESVEDATSPVEERSESGMSAERFGDLRGGRREAYRIFSLEEYSADDLSTYIFNERTVFAGNEELQRTILENGKNPGLGVRGLHEEGITGRGVSVGIIDQNLLLEPPEFIDQIADFYDCGYDFSEEYGSMHGPSVVSILAGKPSVWRPRPGCIMLPYRQGERTLSISPTA